jgi:hypothetical protein
MIELPDFSKQWEYENGFYLTSDNARLGKILAHYELYKMTKGLEGAIVECGIFKGASFVRFAGFRDLIEGSEKKVIGFDTFGAFPPSTLKEDDPHIKHWVENAGEQSISKEQLREVMRKKGIDKNVELVEGDVVKTVPAYVATHPDLTISLLNLDTDIYDPAVAVLEHLWPKLVPGGVLILDDYNVFPGETKAVDDFFKGTAVKIQKFPFAKTPCYIVKE